MKAEINNDSKAKFISLYGGQRVVGHECDKANFELHGISFIDLEVEIYGDWSGGTNPEKSCMDLVGIQDIWLNLKPLSRISDEDLEKLGIKQYRFDFLTGLIHNTRYVRLRSDEFRYLGYAVDWMGLSVEEMVEAGWIKLIEA